MSDVTEAEASRFWAKVDRRSDEECWPWTAGRTRGYGHFHAAGRNMRATHVALLLAGRPKPSSKHCACHTCDNPPCVNPAHLWWGTQGENNRDAAAKGRQVSGWAGWRGRQTHCLKHGHPLEGRNLIIRKNGERACRTCHNELCRQYQQRRKANVAK